MITSPSDVLSKIPRMRDTTANAIVDYFLINKLDWETFKNQIDSIQRFGFCVCGLYATDNVNQYANRNTCLYCRESIRSGILVIPNMDTLRRMERMRSSFAWYHIVNASSRESEIQAIQSLLLNIEHKIKIHNKKPIVRNFLGTDNLSKEIFMNMQETIMEKFGDEIQCIDLPVGIGYGENVNKINDNTLFMMMNTK